MSNKLTPQKYMINISSVSGWLKNSHDVAQTKLINKYNYSRAVSLALANVFAKVEKVTGPSYRSITNQLFLYSTNDPNWSLIIGKVTHR